MSKYSMDEVLGTEREHSSAAFCTLPTESIRNCSMWWQLGTQVGLKILAACTLILSYMYMSIYIQKVQMSVNKSPCITSWNPGVLTWLHVIFHFYASFLADICGGEWHQVLAVGLSGSRRPLWWKPEDDLQSAPQHRRQPNGLAAILCCPRAAWHLGPPIPMTARI